MKELLYTILELEEWCDGGSLCSFCPGLNKAVCQIRVRNKVNDRIIQNRKACESCKEKFENNELPKCNKCGRLQTQSNIDILSGNHICNCVKYQEDTEEKELLVLPVERRQTAFYERQINALQEKEKELTEEVDTHLEALEIAEDWHKRQKQELLDEIEKLKEKVKQLEEQNKKLIPEELAQKIESIESYEKEITELKKQLAQFTSQQQTTKVEVPPKNGSIKHFFRFGGKK